MSLIKPHHHRHVAVHERIAVCPPVRRILRAAPRRFNISNPALPFRWALSRLPSQAGSGSDAVFFELNVIPAPRAPFRFVALGKRMGQGTTEHTTDQSGTIINNQGMCHFAIPGLVR